MTLAAQRERSPGVLEASYLQMQSDSYAFPAGGSLSNIDMPDGSTMWIMNGCSHDGNFVYRFVKILKSGESESLIVEPARLNPSAQMKFLPLQLCLLERSNAVMVKKMEAAQKEEGDFLTQANAMLTGLKRDLLAGGEVKRNLQELSDHYGTQVNEFGKSVIRFKSNADILSRGVHKLEEQIDGAAQEVKKFSSESLTPGVTYVSTANNPSTNLDIHSIFNRIASLITESGSNAPPRAQGCPSMPNGTHDCARKIASEVNGSQLRSLPVSSFTSSDVKPVLGPSSEQPTTSQTATSSPVVQRTKDKGPMQTSQLASSQAARAQTLPEEPSKAELPPEIKEVVIEKDDASLFEKMWNGCFIFLRTICGYFKSFLNPFSSQ